MAKKDMRAKVIKLRLQGFTYGQIKRELNVSKSTLSNWLQNLQLTEKQLLFLKKNKEISGDLRIENYRKTMKEKWTRRLKNVLELEKRELLPLSSKELFIAGLFLYLGEGSKQHGTISISNTNPAVMQFSKYWMTKILKIPEEKIWVRMHLYSDMKVNQEIDYWSKILDMPRKQFKSPYVKKTKREGLTYKSFGHGTCNLLCFDTGLSERIAMSIKLITEYCGAKNENFWYN